jgi:hypothetical protein
MCYVRSVPEYRKGCAMLDLCQRSVKAELEAKTMCIGWVGCVKAVLFRVFIKNGYLAIHKYTVSYS